MNETLDTEELLQALHSFTIFFILLIVLCVVSVIVLIIALIRLQKSARARRGTAEHLSHVIQAQEDERARISAELHDTVAQDLRYVQLVAGRVTDKALRDELDGLLRGCVSSVRNLCYRLAPPDLSAQDLTVSMQSLCAMFQKRTGLAVSLVTGDAADYGFLTQRQNLNVYRIVQEALANVEKHAEAREVSVILRRESATEERGLYAIVTDDGRGFSEEKYGDATGGGGSFGMRSMRQRAVSMGGRLGINSMPGEGTEVLLFIPQGGYER